MKRILFTLLSIFTLQTTLPIQQNELTEAELKENVVHHHHYNVKFRGIASLITTGSILLLGWRYGKPTYKHIKPFIKMPKTLDDLQSLSTKEFKLIREKFQALTSYSYKMNIKISQIKNNMATKNDIQRIEKLAQKILYNLDKQASYNKFI